jgi:hypothetical protein
MFDDHSGFQGPPPEQHKLILPGSNEDTYYPGAQTQRTYIHPDQMRAATASRPGNPLAKAGDLWRRDPAYKVLMIASATILLAGIIFATFLASMFAQAASTSQNNTTVSAKPTSATSIQPTFPTPSSGQGGTNSGQPTVPTEVPTPTAIPSPTPTAQATAQPGLSPQIVSIPQQVRTNTFVPVMISVGQPGVEVRLEVTYNQGVAISTSGPKMTDDAGNVTLIWNVMLFSLKQQLVAHVTAFALNQNGQEVPSQTISVKVTNKFKFG